MARTRTPIRVTKNRYELQRLYRCVDQALEGRYWVWVGTTPDGQRLAICAGEWGPADAAVPPDRAYADAILRNIMAGGVGHHHGHTDGCAKGACGPAVVTYFADEDTTRTGGWDEHRDAAARISEAVLEWAKGEDGEEGEGHVD